LIITCDNNAAATTIIPQIARGHCMTAESRCISPDLWEIHLRRS
jgi:hypothetical protein